MQVEVAQYVRVVVIGKADVLKFDVAAHVRKFRGARRIGDVGLFGQQLAEAREARRARGEGLHERRQAADGLEEHADVERERDEPHVVEAALHDEVSTPAITAMLNRFVKKPMPHNEHTPMAE